MNSITNALKTIINPLQLSTHSKRITTLFLLSPVFPNRVTYLKVKREQWKKLSKYFGKGNGSHTILRLQQMNAMLNFGVT